MSTFDAAELTSTPLPPIQRFDRRLLTADVAVQVSHRAAILAFFAFLAAIGLLYVGDKMTAVTWAVGAMFVFADIGACGALLGRSLLNPSKCRREATIVLLFNATLFVLSMQLMLFTRLELIRVAAQAFFKPE